VPIYGYLSRYLNNSNFDLLVISDGIQAENPHSVNFQYERMRLSTASITRFIVKQKIDVIIDYMELRHLYLFPTYFTAKGLLRRKMIYWGQGRDLLDPEAGFKNVAYAVEQAMCDAIILYAEHLKKYVPPRFHNKVFIANNTLYLNYTGLQAGVTKEQVLAEYGIRTKRNIVCMGRMQKRKRLNILIDAFDCMNKRDVGLILIGPDPEGILDRIAGDNIYKPGPIYGDKKFDLLSSCDVFCLPGAIGLSIIDAFYCGLPFVTEDGDESAERTYLKDGINGFIVQRGNVQDMAQKLLLLLDDTQLRERFSEAAKREIKENGNIDKMCAGFRDAISYAVKDRSFIAEQTL
jgi:glycosyltransferase involved in cell wall biosynthesis